MPQFFVSYRRVDSADVTGRIYDHLSARFGNSNVFKDVDSIPLGDDFREKIETAVSSCNVLLVVIGDDWLTVSDETGARRIDNKNDYVHLEIDAALTRGITVIPILVEGASMPSPDDLPESVRDLAFRNAIQVRSDPDFRNDIERLSTRLTEYFDQMESGEVEEQRDSHNRIMVSLLIISFVLIAGTIIVVIQNWSESEAVVSDEKAMLETLKELVDLDAGKSAFALELQRYCNDPMSPLSFSKDELIAKAAELTKTIDEILGALREDSHSTLVLSRFATYRDLQRDLQRQKEILATVSTKRFSPTEGVDWQSIGDEYVRLHDKLKNLIDDYSAFLSSDAGILGD